MSSLALWRALAAFFLISAFEVTLASSALAHPTGKAHGGQAHGRRDEARRPHVHQPAVAGRFSVDPVAKTSLTHQNFVNDPEAFQFVIVSDNTGGARTGVFASAVDKINLLQPEFVVSVGDLIEGYSESSDILTTQWAEFESMVARIEAPFFYTPGNHDYSNNVMAELWAKKFGRSYYHFLYKDVLFVVLNTERSRPGGGDPTIDAEQRAYLADVLANNPSARWTLLFMHQPVWSVGHDNSWSEVEKVLGDRPFTAIAGHMHTYDYVSRGGRDLITLATTGGGSQLRGEAYGEFDHVTWVTMKKTGPMIANLRLDGISDKIVTAPGFSASLSKVPTFAFEPWTIGADGKPAASLKLVVANPFDAPLRFSLDAPQNPSVQLRADPPIGEVAPRTTKVLDIPVAVAPAGVIRPLEVRATAKLNIGGRDVSWTGAVRARPVALFTLARAAKPVAFDGGVGEWGGLRFAGEAPVRGRDGETTVAPADASFRFDAAYDDAFLYVAVDVRDDEVTPGILSGKHDAQDLAILTLDARPTRQSAANAALVTGLKAGDWIAIMGSPNDRDGEKLFGSIIPPMFEVKTKRTPAGYSAEFRVPLAYVQSKHPDGPWTDVRINVSVNDADPKGKPTRGPLSLSWQSDWREQISGTGTFLRK